MKKLVIALIVLFAFGTANAGDLDFTAAKTLTPVTADGIRVVDFYANADGKYALYRYYFYDSNNNIIRPYPGANERTGLQEFICRNQDSVPAYTNTDCTAAGVPDACCTGVGTGTCDATFANADCVADGDPFSCCKALDVGTCSCWDDIKTNAAGMNTTLKGEIAKDLNVTFP